ncbi:hypothetical protein [Actinacidiphila glaucinigra]|uniref:hypothetical protein n=1 Tax=Actinacidiphila glaucinigra TaxID=235986 RepID=UPI0035D86658
MADLATTLHALAPARRLVAAGVIRRDGARTIRVTITTAGVTGSIRPAGGAR